MKWNESGFRPPLCTYRLNWARRTSWGWWDDWDDTVLQTQDSKFEPWRSEAEHATSRSRRLPTILTFTRGWGRNNFVSFKPPRPGTEPRTLAWKAAVLTTTLGPPPTHIIDIQINRKQLRGFIKLKKIKIKIREKLGSGWVGQAPTRIIIFGGKFCVFCVVFMFPNVSKKKSDRRVIFLSHESEFFSDFLIFFNLTRPLTKTFMMISN